MLFAATGGDVLEEGIWGEYIVPDWKVAQPSKQVRAEVLQEKLWELNVRLMGKNWAI